MSAHFFPLVAWLGVSSRDVNKDLTPKDQDKDKDLTPQGPGQGQGLPGPDAQGPGQGLEICS